MNSNFYFDRNLSVNESIIGIAKNLLNEAILECNSTELTNQQKIHSLRKKCKRIRGLLRIVRPNIGELYKKENVYFRDLARTLSNSRDQFALIETLEKLQNICDDNSIKEVITNIIGDLKLNLNDRKFKSQLKNFHKSISSKLRQVKSWHVNSSGFLAVSGGIKKTYRRGQNAMYAAFENQTMENYHEWRKRVKYHYYHLELITPIWETILIQHTNEVHSLSEKLGYDHDLCVLENHLIINKKYSLNDISIQTLLNFINLEKNNTRKKIGSLGKRIYSEKPRDLIYKLDSWWNVWESEIVEE